MIINKEDNFFIVNILNEYIGDIDIFNFERMVNFFKSIIKNIKKKYFINGLCDLIVYYDENYGMILEICNYDDQMIELDIKVKINLNINFMVEIDYNDDNYDNIYYYDGKYYTYYRPDIDSEIIYKDTLNIIHSGIKIK